MERLKELKYEQLCYLMLMEVEAELEVELLTLMEVEMEVELLPLELEVELQALHSNQKFYHEDNSENLLFHLLL